MSELYSLLTQIETCFGIRICVHDVSGITFTVPALELPYLWKTHGGAYCTAAKEATSEQSCMRQKEIALHKLQRNGGKAYCGICSKGVCDYVEPVKMDGRLIAVVFASGVIRDQCNQAKEKLTSYLEKEKLSSPELVKEHESFSNTAGTTKDQLRFFAELTKQAILRAAQTSAHRVVPSKDSYPVESVRTWRVGMASLLISYLEENYRNRITLKMLSQRFLLSEVHINRLVKKDVHMGAMTYVKYLRLEAATKALTGSEKTIHEIGEAVGYADTNYFCRIFKSAYGMTPTEYRTKYSRMNNENKIV